MNVAENLSLEDIDGEIWKDIEDYEGFYQVSSFGRVRSLDKYDSLGRFYAGKILKHRLNKGYKK